MFASADSSMGRVTVEIYKNKILLETKLYVPPKPAGEILDHLRDNHMEGDLRLGDLSLSATDILGDTATYELHLAEPGVISFDIAFLQCWLHRHLAVRILSDHNACLTDDSFC